MADGDVPVVPPVDPNAAPPVAASPAAPAVPLVPPVELQAGNIPDGVFQRIDRLTRDKKEAQERADRAEAALAQARGQQPPPVQQQPPAPAPQFQPPGAPLGAEALEARARELAMGMAAQQNFTDKCNNIAREGSAAHADFQQVMGRMGQLGALDMATINAALEIGDPHELLYSLGQDPAEAMRIAGLSPEQKAVALMKFDLARKGKAAALISKAPEPPPVQLGGGQPPATEELKPTDKSEDWFAKREKQKGIFSGNYDNKRKAS